MQQTVVADEEQVVAELTKRIAECARSALKETGVFRVGLSGGSVLNYLCTAIPRIDDSDLSRWRFYFCDERYVDEADADSTFGEYKRKLIPATGLSVEQFACIRRDLPLEQCAVDYEQRMLDDFALVPGEIPRFDLLLLGMGPDGHTCSLFPQHALLQERKRLVAPIGDSPKPPPQRVTMTLPLINNAKCCIFAMCGAGKADIVKRVFVDKEELPAGLVAPKWGELICIFDAAAGKYIKQ